MADPLRIDAVTTSAGGTVGMTMCPGRVDRTESEGAIIRVLDADLATIADWRPDVIVTLVEDHEPAMLGVPDLFRRLPMIAQWRHHPIGDMGVPTDTARWTDLLDDLLARLDTGARVLIHCRAGRGRTGMLAATLLVRSGMSADRAITTVRAVRPGTLETDAQLDIVRAAASPHGSRFASCQ
jgi:hypothetical protein